MFWLFAVALTIVAVILGFAPLWRRKPDAVSHADHDFDLTVYRNQLSELDADHARGVVSGAEYEQARVEVARRIVAAEDAVTKAQAASSGAASNSFVLPAFALLFVPVLSGLFYVELGSPGLDAQPLAARLNAVDPDGPSEEIRLLVERAEEHLRVNPSDVRGWDVLGPIYLRLNRPQKAVTAYQNAITLDGRTAARLSGLGEAIVAQAGGVVTDDALARFEETLELNPADTRAGFFAGLAAAQSGELDLASRTWLASTDGAAQGDPWAEMSRRFIAQAEVQASGEATDGAAPKIDPETAAAVQSMDAGEQQAMIADMVDGLDARLREDPKDIEGWLRLIRARVVMGETDKASDALRTSLTVFADDGAESERLRMLAAELNLALGEGG